MHLLECLARQCCLSECLANVGDYFSCVDLLNLRRIADRKEPKLKFTNQIFWAALQRGSILASQPAALGMNHETPIFF